MPLLKKLALPGRQLPKVERRSSSNDYGSGEFEATDNVSARLDIAAKCRKAFRDNKLKGEIFVAVGKDWAWLRREILDEAPSVTS